MKKGLLSILASALLVVGCQNYDDQFSALETQINALASTVAGLSQVQSDLSSLAGTVASLSSSVAGLGSQIDTAVADGLADITADVAAIQTAVADVASSEEVAALQTAVDDSQTDLDELLANSSVFNGSITINSVSTLAAFKAMGSTLAIINGSVDIDVNAEMSQADVQTVVNEMLTITGDFAYDAVTKVPETTFTNLSGVQSITVSQEGGYQFPALVSASNITLGTTFSSKIKVIDFGLLTSVTKFSSTADHQVHFNKATNFHITSLPRYGASLSVLLDEGSTFLMDALEDKSAADVQSALALTIEGPAVVDISKLDGKGGSISLKDVVTATITDYDGDITLLSGVENFSSNNVVEIVEAGATDLVSFTAKGVIDPNATAATPDTSGPDLELSSLGDLTDVTLSGDFAAIKLDANNNMTDVTITAKASNGAITISNNGDLTNLDLTDSSATGVTIDDNDNLATAAIKTTMVAGTAAAAVIDGVVVVTDNDDLTELEIWSSGLKTLTITGNSDLTKITGTKIVALGATVPTAAAPQTTVNISNNDLEASVAQVLTPATAANAGDSTGAFTSASNMSTLSAYLKLVAEDVYSTANVYFDTVQSTTDSLTVETGSTTTGQVAANAILVTAPGSGGVTTGANAAAYATKAWLVDVSDLASIVTLTLDSQPMLHTGSAYTTELTFAGAANASSQAITLSQLMTTESTSRATLLGATFNVYKGGNAVMPGVTFTSRVSSDSNGENYTDASAIALYGASAALGVNASLTTHDKITYTMGGLSVDASIATSGLVAGRKTGASARDAIADALIAAWNGKYGTAGTASFAMSVWGAMSADTNGAIPAVALKSSTAGSRGYLTQNNISLTFTAASAATISIATSGAATNSFLDWTIGADGSADNIPTSIDLILTMKGSASQDLSGLVITDGTMDADSGLTTLTSAEYKYSNAGAGTATTTTLNVYPTDARNDVVNAEGANEGTTTAVVPRTLTNRSQWTFGS